MDIAFLAIKAKGGIIQGPLVFDFYYIYRRKSIPEIERKKKQKKNKKTEYLVSIGDISLPSFEYIHRSFHQNRLDVGFLRKV